MSSTPEILLLAQPTDRAENLIFLLHLANYQTIHITDDVEAFNYVAQRQRSTQPLSLILIDIATVQQQFLQLLNDLKRCNAMLPILLTYKEKPLPLEQLNCAESLQKMITQCPTNQTYACIQKLFLSHPQAGPQVS